MDTESLCARICGLCPTRWTVRAASLKSILDNFAVLLKVWEESLKHVRDTEMKARIQAVASQTVKFDFGFFNCLAIIITTY